MSESIVPQHAVCFNLHPDRWDELFKNSTEASKTQSIQSGHLVWDKDKQAYFPAMDEIFKHCVEATSAMSKYATVVASGVMTVFITSDQLADLTTLSKSMDILAYCDDEDGSSSGGAYADVRVHLPFE